jgi:hypothetical protein
VLDLELELVELDMVLWVEQVLLLVLLALKPLLE